MGAVPRKKLTRPRKRRRLSNAYRLSPLHPALCSRCRSAKLPHVVCPQCGFYRGRQVIGNTA